MGGRRLISGPLQHRTERGERSHSPRSRTRPGRGRPQPSARWADGRVNMERNRFQGTPPVDGAHGRTFRSRLPGGNEARNGEPSSRRCRAEIGGDRGRKGHPRGRPTPHFAKGLGRPEPAGMKKGKPGVAGAIFEGWPGDAGDGDQTSRSSRTRSIVSRAVVRPRIVARGA